MPSERTYISIDYTMNEHLVFILRNKKVSLNIERELTVSKSSEYKSFKVLDFDAPPNINRILPS